MRRYIGLGKTLYNSSVCSLEASSGLGVEILLSERFDRKKNSGASPLSILSKLDDVGGIERISESADVADASEKELILNEKFPFTDFLKSKNLTLFSKLTNPEVVTVGHHRSHALSACLRSPFERSLVFVMDGAGSSVKTLRQTNHDDEKSLLNGREINEYEHLSTYLFENGKIQALSKEFMEFERSQGVSIGTSPGIFYETIAKFIFNSHQDPGKVMGLAPFGKGEKVSDLLDFQRALDWTKAFQGKGKNEWESHPHKEFYKNLAATAQKTFEAIYLEKIKELAEKFPDVENLILTGGCALNCTANWKLRSLNLFKNIYVSPYPGDESIGLGAAAYSWFENHHPQWKPVPWSEQVSFFGSKKSLPTDDQIKKTFENYHCTQFERIELESAKLIAAGEVIAWFQGRSECGPRALGHRSILARPDRENLKAYLNQHIKFREDFRPYGCTVMREDAHEYFDVSSDFENPFMSYAVPVRGKHKKLLEHVTHIDHTSRMQTLYFDQDPLFYSLLRELKTMTGHGIVLNTSLNVMNEPILESVDDALRFFENSKVDALVVGQFIIRKKK